MEWYVFALLAPAFWALNNVFIKFLITNKFKGYFPMIFAVVSMDLIFALGVLVFAPVVFVYPYSIFAFGVGLMPLLAFWFYARALMKEEVSRIATLFQLIPVFVALLSVVFLGEFLGLPQYIGMVLIVSASILISYRRSVGNPFSGVLKFMLPFGIIIAAYTISDKILLGYLDFWSVFFWNVLGTFCGALSMLSSPSLRSEVLGTIRAVGKRALSTTFIGEGLYVVGTICSLIALSMVEAPLASSLFGLQPFYVFFYTIALSLFLPQILKEEIGRSTLLLKICAIALMFAGTLLVI